MPKLSDLSNLLRTGAALVVAMLCLPAAAQAMTPPAPPITVTDPPESFVFKDTMIGGTDSQYFSVTNHGTEAVKLGQVYLTDRFERTCVGTQCDLIQLIDVVYSFYIGISDGCSGTTLQPQASCSTLVQFMPFGVGTPSTSIAFPIVGGYTVTRTIQGKGTTQPLECVLDWAEKQFPTMLPVSSTSKTFQTGMYYARCYDTNICIGADAVNSVMLKPVPTPPQLYVYQNQQLQALGKLEDFAVQAQCPVMPTSPAVPLSAP